MDIKIVDDKGQEVNSVAEPMESKQIEASVFPELEAKAIGQVMGLEKDSELGQYKDKIGTPLKLVNGLTTVAATTGPTIYNFQTPIKMVSGIDVITAGAVAAVIDVWIDYYQ